MLNTISECNEELSKLNSELERIKLERNHVLAVRELLRKQDLRETIPSNIRQTASLQSKVLEIVRAEPGINMRGVLDILSEGHTPRQITTALTALRREQNQIENRGGRGQGARWYIKED
jgi:uncharacterized protein (UPF0147 family)